MSGDRALLRFLARQGRISADDATRVEKLLEEPGTTAHDVLERESIISQKDLATLLANTLRLRIIDLTTYPLDANVTRELKETIATRYEVVPIAIDERSIEVATANPLDLEGLKAVEFATGKRVQAVVATHVEVKDALAHTYRLQESLEQFLNLVPAGEQLVVNELDDDGADLRTVAADAELPPVIKLADKMLIEGIKSRASDIHLEPGTDSVLVRYRVDGILEEAFRFPKWIQNPLVARLKVMAKLDITERRLPQDGRIQVRYQDKTVDMRVSSLPAQHGEKITLRILDASQAVKALDRLGFGATDLKVLRDAAKKPQGMILITGPTGSGKTTTLYALLREIFSPKTNIVTIENPIEYQLKGINQVEVNEKQGLTFGGVLRSVLRQDPDVILLGEIRDKETAQIAFQAASTGHLVLSTVHTNDAAGAVTRLLDLGLEPYAVASALNLVVAQRLVRQLCPTCSAPATVDDDARQQLRLGDDVGSPKRAVGCAQCRHTGYRSRTGIYEMLPMTNALVKLVEAGAGESMVRQQARSDGMHSLLDDAVEKLRAGVTSVEELQRVVQITDEGGTRCPGCQKQIAEDYSVCPHCSRVLHAVCGGCSKPLNPEWVRCPFCGTAVETGAGESAAPAERRSFTALVVDDTPTIRDVVQHALDHSDLGLTVMTAENGPMALEIASRERPDIVILDISMPDMDGYEVCRRLRSDMRTAFVPVLMLTAHDSEEDVAKGFGVGADDYMVKPFRREGLLARVRRILERTYGAQALPATAPADPAAAAGAFAPPVAASYAPPARDAAGIDVGAALAALQSDRDALRGAVERCELRIGELLADKAVNGGQDAAAPDVLPALAELRTLIGEMRTAQDRALAELRTEAARAVALAEDALRTAGSAATPAPGIDPAVIGMQATLERLQEEQSRLGKMVASAATETPGIDEECERRLRQATQDVVALRASVADLEAGWQREVQQLRAETQAGWQREVQELREQARAEVERARRAVEDRAAAAVERAASAEDKSTAGFTSLRQEVIALRDELDAQRGELGREGTRLRAAEERVERLQAEALDGVEKSARQLAALQRAIGEHQEQRGHDVERVAAAEDAARRARAELAAATAELGEQLAAVRRTIGEQRDGTTHVGSQLGALEAIARNAEQAAQAVAGELGARITDVATRLDGEVDAVKRMLAAQCDDRARNAEQAVEAVAGDLGGSIAALADRLGVEIQALQRTCAAHDEDRARDAERVASADQVVLALHAEIDAAAVRTDRQLGELRDGFGRECDAIVDHARRLQSLEEASQQSQDALAWTQGRLAQVRRVLVKLVRRAGGDRRALATEVDARLAAIPAPVADDSQARLAGQVAGLVSVTERLEGEQRRLAADVEERLRALMRTAAGGFDVQLALLRGKVEVLARTLRERGAVDPTAPLADPMLAHRHGLLDRLREQLTALQSGTEWRPQRVLDLLIESTLSAAVTPFRKMLQLAEGEQACAPDQAAPDADAPDQGARRAPVTDESAGPSSDP